MPSKYDQAAINKARTLYCKFGGENFDAIQKEMQKEYPTWSKQNLIERGKEGKNPKLGWIIEHNFEKSLQEYLKIQTVSINNDEEKLYLGVKKAREILENKVTGDDAKPTRDDLYAYRDFAKLEMELRKNLDLSKDNYANFVACFEKMLAWLPEIDETVATTFLSGDIAERLLERARIEYGEETKSAS